LLAAVIPFLRCPHCGEGFALEGGSLHCPSGHAFDIARQGYVSLISGSGGVHHGDSGRMVSAREAFLGAGHLAGLRDAVAATAEEVVSPEAPPGAIVDAGAGTGYYLAGVLDHLPEHVGTALDASTFALRRAARSHARAAAIGCDVWGRLPLADACADLILDIFAPRNGLEFGRILRAHGRLIVVTPTPRHLRELVAPLGLISVDAQKGRRLESGLSPGFAPVGSTPHEQILSLNESELTALVSMGPSARHLDEAELGGRIVRLLQESASENPHAGSADARISVTASVLISVYRKN
jgi:23S rRNA (guanine745-N1)-methyltransferase